MKILFDSALDGTAWPHWFDGQKGRLGEIRVGRQGLLGILETILGLRGPTVPEGVRVAALVSFVQDSKEAFWTRSAEVDPFGVAKKLIQLHDFLIMHGWQGQALTSRLSDLAALADKIIPGVPHRLGTVLSALDDYAGPLPNITLLEPLDSLPLLIQKIFIKLQQLGAGCILVELSAVQSGENDLGTARNDKLNPVGDGSLQLVRPDGVLQAADDIAAWLALVAEEEGLRNTVIIGADAVLDNALHRFGLPATGAAAESGNSLMQLLPLVLAMGWEPPDPARIMELLTLPASPVPPVIGHRLINALSKWPASGSELWQEKLDEGLASIEDQARRERTEARLNILFAPLAKNNYPVTEINGRVNMLTRWLRGRFHDDLVAHPALGQCQIFLTMVEAMGLDSLTEPLLKKLLDEASSAQCHLPSLPAQAGLAAVSAPESIIGSATRIVWWNFSKDTVPSLTIPLLSAEERQALVEVGLVLPDSAMLADCRANRWHRPLDYASQQLVLVCPVQDTAGEELHPHPLWDELLAASDDKAGELISAKIGDYQSIPTITPDQLQVPEAQTSWQVAAGAVKPRDKESPSSLENFLGCPFKWSLNYNAFIRGGHSATLPDLASTLGSLAHQLVEEVLGQDILPTADAGAVLAGKLFDQKAPQLVATLFQEGMEAKKEDIRNTVVLATQSLLQHLHDAGVGKLTIEQRLSSTFGAQQLQGYADIVLDKPFMVIDLKRSWAKFFKKKMTSGTALQIIIYGWLLKEAHGVFPELAYYTLEDQTFLTTDVKHFSRGEEVNGPSLEKVWTAFEDTFNNAWQVLESGLVLCPGNGAELKSGLEDDRLIIEPPCRFCDYDVLCGRRFVTV